MAEILALRKKCWNQSWKQLAKKLTVWIAGCCEDDEGILTSNSTLTEDGKTIIFLTMSSLSAVGMDNDERHQFYNAEKNEAIRTW